MSLIQVNHLSFYYDGSYDMIFEDVTCSIDSDWKLGFVGRNGRGKTTFLNLLMGKYEYVGSITASVDFDYFPFQVKHMERDTVEVAQEVCPDYEFWKLCRELSLLSVDMDVLYRPFFTLSNGERTKVLLALLFTRENRFLLIDEPTNHLDLDARRAVSAYLRKKKGFILVSHDRTFLDSCIDHVLAINRTGLEVVQGNFSSWWENKNRRDEYEAQENKRLKKDIERLKEAARRTEKWSDAVEKTKIGTRNSGLRPDRGFIGHKSAKMMKRAKSTKSRAQDAIEEKSKLLKDVETVSALKIIPLVHHKEELIHLEHASFSYGDREVVQDVTFQLRRGDKIALQGKNGCGKSTILKAILDRSQVSGKGETGPFWAKEPAGTGRMRIGGNVELASGLVISYVPQDTDGLEGTVDEFAKTYGLDETLFRTLLQKLDFSRDQFEKNMAAYSAGQKKKVLIAKSLCEQAHLYLWDEPLNYIDLFSRMQIEELIKTYRLTVLFVEHDQSFIEAVGARIIDL